MKVLWIIISLFMTACYHSPVRSPGDANPLDITDTELRMIVHKFESKTGTKIKALVIYLQLMEGVDNKTLGKCYKSSPSDIPEVAINYTLWRDLSNYEKEAVVFHELGHCILNRPHSHDNKSLMYMFHIGGTRYKTYYNEYIKDLSRPTTDIEVSIFFSKKKRIEEEVSFKESLRKGTTP